MKLNFKNKRGDIETMIYIVITIFAVGIVFLLVNNLNQEIFTQLDSELNETYNGTEAVTVLQDIKTKDQDIWDYAFIGIFMGSLMCIALSAYAIRINPIFFWIYVLISLIVLAVGVIASNTWQDFASEPDFAVTITHFPMTNALLGTYFPLVVTGVIIISLGFLFGKPIQE